MTDAVGLPPAVNDHDDECRPPYDDEGEIRGARRGSDAAGDRRRPASSDLRSLSSSLRRQRTRVMLDGTGCSVHAVKAAPRVLSTGFAVSGNPVMQPTVLNAVLAAIFNFKTS